MSTHERSDRPAGQFEWLNALVDGNHLARLSAGEMRVLIVFFRHANPRGEAYPGPKRVAERAGMSIRNVSRCISHLVRMGYLSRGAEGAGRGNIARRRLLIPQNGAQASGFLEGEDTAQADHKTGRSRSRKQGAVGPENRAQSVHKTGRRASGEQNREQPSNSKVAAGAAADDCSDALQTRGDDVVGELRRLGIGGSKLAELARMDGITASGIRRVTAGIEGARNKAAVAISRIEAEDWPARRSEDADAARRAEAERERRRQAERQTAEESRRRAGDDEKARKAEAANRQRLAAIPDADRNAMWTRYLQTLDEPLKRIWARTDPLGERPWDRAARTNFVAFIDAAPGQAATQADERAALVTLPILPVSPQDAGKGVGVQTPPRPIERASVPRIATGAADCRPPGVEDGAGAKLSTTEEALDKRQDDEVKYGHGPTNDGERAVEGGDSRGPGEPPPHGPGNGRR